MPCRAVHTTGTGEVNLQPYGKPGEAIYSASRSLLNTTVLDACETYPTLIKTFFEHKMEGLSEDGAVTFLNVKTKEKRTVQARLVIGADGAYSAVRAAMLRISRIDFSRKYIRHGYKELNMPPVKGDFALPISNALHIWPRRDFMLIALPNPDQSFTCTLFLPWPQLEELDADAGKARAFFEQFFPDALPLIADFETQFSTHPSSALVMVDVNPWNLGDKAVLIGDAAHATVPFYGQGANCAFEDCLAFTECLDACKSDVNAAATSFAVTRKPAGDALNKLSLDNYSEMADKTASDVWLLRKKIEGVLAWALGDRWIPLYSMVSFTRIPYQEVVRRAERQDRIISAAATGVAIAAVSAGAYAFTKLLLPKILQRVAELKRTV